MKKVAAKEKTYIFQTIDQDGCIGTYEVDSFTFDEAKKYRNHVVGNSRCGEEPYGRITLKN